MYMKTLIFLFSVVQLYSQQSLLTERNNIDKIRFTQEELIGRHTISEWRHLIDSTWGEGNTTAQKVQIFNNFWNTIDQHYAAFEGIIDNWEQIHNYQDTIAQGLSKGRFAGLLNYIGRTLHDGHIWIEDETVSGTILNRDVPLMAPLGIEYPSFNWGITDHFGAALTPLPDSTLLVYKAVPDHPLGLVPGDIVLGYDGELWKNLYDKLLEVQFPMSIFVTNTCSDRSATHQSLGSAGMNWHFFDTIDIVKYSTGDTLHLSTDPLATPMPGIHATEQLPVSGVPFPDIANGHHVSWGYVDGTNIGYIYVLGWNFLNSIDDDFLSAVNTFMADSSSDGLVIDVRINEGCDAARWTKGFRRLFNQDFVAVQLLKRANTSNHLEMQSATEWDWLGNLTGTDNELYDRPIAVLCGPWTASGGDFSVQLLRQHPMVHTFGMPTEGAFGVFQSIVPGLPNDFFAGITVAVGYIPPDWNNRLYRRSVPVDEEVWLTPDGVANGVDDVVEKALEWINNLVYPHNVFTSKSYYKPGTDTLRITADIENPNNHSVTGRIYIYTISDELIDSVDLANEIHSQSTGWSAEWIIPPSEETYKLLVTAIDITESKSFTLPNATRFTTAGPVRLDSVSFMEGSGDYYFIRPFVSNEGTELTITNAQIRLLCNDPWAIPSDAVMDLSEIPPGGSVGASGWFTLHYIDSLFPGYFNLKFEILSDGWTYWKDSTNIIDGITGNNTRGLRAFGLEQNYPNPFNPETKIKYSIKEPSKVTLKVYDILGREIAILINDNKPSGTYELNWNAANLPSGCYFYKLTAGNYTAVKKMIYLK